MNHYRCFNTYVTETGKERVTDTLSWHPATLKLPGSSPLEELTTAITEMNGVFKKFLTAAPSLRAQRTSCRP